MKHAYMLLLNLVRIFSQVIPLDWLRRIPVTGIVTITLPQGMRLQLDSNSEDYISTVLFWRGIKAFEPETIEVFMHFASVSACVFDIGANIGIYSLLASSINPKSRVFAFEPVPRVFEHLRKNSAINRMDGIECIPSAVTDRNGSVAMYVPLGAVPSAASLVIQTETEYEMINVEATTVDDFVALKKIPAIDLVKIDTEGNEAAALRGATDTLKRDKPIIFAEVLTDEIGNNIEKILEPLGYHFYWITQKGLINMVHITADTHTRERNYLFVASDKLARVEELLHRRVAST